SAKFINAGTFTPQNNVNLTFLGDATAVSFENTGTLTITGNTVTFTGDIYSQVAFDNSGLLNMQGGVVALNGGGTSSGAFTVATHDITVAVKFVWNSGYVQGTGTLTTASLVLADNSYSYAGGEYWDIDGVTLDSPGLTLLTASLPGAAGTFYFAHGARFLNR